MTFLRVLLALLFSVAISGVALANPSDPRPGIGRSDEDPVGKPFELPAGLVLQEPIDGHDRDRCKREGEATDLKIGHGTSVDVCLSFTNTTPEPIQVSLPAGLIVVSISDETQNGLLIITETFEVPPGDDPYFVRLGLHCLNIGRAPGGARDFFKLGPVTEDEQLLSVIALLDGLKIRDDLDDHIGVQDYVWNVSDNQRLYDHDRAWLASLQNR
ncbi:MULTISPECIES: hypothetical protein [unclassified Brevundimonas]|uniref:hypothetical protein n=1 Tax=unclassified Brevundimonas TaxID=2622653 RepID=UPI0025C69971|nr:MULTISPECIES: hypothetical protein [unclassified Brevundimonas]